MKCICRIINQHYARYHTAFVINVLFIAAKNLANVRCLYSIIPVGCSNYLCNRSEQLTERVGRSVDPMCLSIM